MRCKWLLPILLAAVIAAGAASAEMYQWVDEDGVKRYSNSPPPEDVEEYDSWSEIAYDEEADRLRTADDDRAIAEYTALKEKEAEIERQRAEAEARQQEVEKIQALKDEQERISRELKSKNRYIRTRARRRTIKLKNIETELASLPATPENKEKIAQLEAERQQVIDGLIRNKRYFQRGGQALVKDYEAIDNLLKEYNK